MHAAMAALDRLLAPLRRRLALLVSRAAVLATRDGAKLQTCRLKLLAHEAPVPDVERFGEYGLASRPQAPDAAGGPEAIAVAVGGARGHLVILAVEDRRFRLRALEEGEVALYDDLGQAVHLTRAGIVVKGAGLPVRIEDTPSVEIDADLNVTGSVTAQQNVVAVLGDVSDSKGTAMTLQAIRTTFNAHQHSGGGNPPIPPPM